RTDSTLFERSLRISAFLPRDKDLAEELVLPEVDDDAAIEVQQRDEGDDRERERRILTEQRSERDGALSCDELLDLGGALLYRVPLGRHLGLFATSARGQGEDARPSRGEGVAVAAARGQLDGAALTVEGALA